MSNLFSRITTFINRIVDVVSSGNLERVRLLREFNQIFREVYVQGEFERLCVVTTAPGNPQFRHELSYHYFRSGFKITIENDNDLKENDFIEILKYICESKAFIRQLMALGYDTLIIKGKNYIRGLEIPLKELASLQDYMLN